MWTSKNRGRYDRSALRSRTSQETIRTFSKNYLIVRR